MMNIHTIISSNVCVISVAFILATAAYAAPGGKGGGDKTTLGSLSPACVSGQIAQYNGTAWQCVTVASGGGEVPQFEVLDNTTKLVGTFVGFSGPNIAQVIVEEDSKSYLLEATSDGFVAHPRVNVNPDFAGDSRRPVIYYYSNDNCAGDVYTHPGNFDPPFGGGFASALSDIDGYVVVLEGGAANLYLKPVSSEITATFNSVRYMGRCINNYYSSLDGNDLAALDVNDFDDLPGDVALNCASFGSYFFDCTVTGIVQLDPPIIDFHSTYSTPFTLNKAVSPP